MIVGVERFFKAAIVDRNTSISSAALVSSYHLHPVAKDVIKRWANEAAEAVQNKGGYTAQYGQGYSAPGSSSSIVQYHALGLLHLIRQGDRMAVTKMIQQLSGAKGSGGTLKSPFAICMLIRYASKVMEEDPKFVLF
jgi:coatomer protein complex subunit gamma